MGLEGIPNPRLDRKHSNYSLSTVVCREVNRHWIMLSQFLTAVLLRDRANIGISAEISSGWKTPEHGDGEPLYIFSFDDRISNRIGSDPVEVVFNALEALDVVLTNLIFCVLYYYYYMCTPTRMSTSRSKKNMTANPSYDSACVYMKPGIEQTWEVADFYSP